MFQTFLPKRTQGKEQNVLAAIESRAFTRRSMVFWTSSTLFERLPLRDSFSCSSSSASMSHKLYTSLRMEGVDLFKKTLALRSREPLKRLLPKAEA